MLVTKLGLCWVQGRGVVLCENEAAYVLWNEVQEADYSMCKSIGPFKEHKFNKTCEVAWKKEDEIDYGY